MLAETSLCLVSGGGIEITKIFRENQLCEQMTLNFRISETEFFYLPCTVAVQPRDGKISINNKLL